MFVGIFKMLMYYYIQFMSVVMYQEILNVIFINVKSNKFILIFVILKIFFSYIVENFFVFKVVLEMRSLRLGLNFVMFFIKLNKTFV